jgi:tRNA(Ile)-lysidine synthase
VDSTALFGLLLDHQIPFEAAHVNYQSRPESDEEARSVATLCQRYQIRLHACTHPLEGANFEARARAIRYRFFEQLIDQEGFKNLLTAHQLNDMLEWHLMQLLKGVGLMALQSMDWLESRPDYRLVRPLLGVDRGRIEAYLADCALTSLHDRSNDDRRFHRNQIRHDFARDLMAINPDGIARSFKLMGEEKRRLLAGIAQTTHQRLRRIGTEHPLWAEAADRWIKQLGALASHHERHGLLNKKDGVIARRVAIGFDAQSVWVAPFVQGVLPRSYRDRCRRAKIPPLIRPYLYAADFQPEMIASDQPDGDNHSQQNPRSGGADHQPEP